MWIEWSLTSVIPTYLGKWCINVHLCVLYQTYQRPFNPSLCCWWPIWPIQNHAKNLKITETLAHGHSSESAQWELSYEYPHDSVWMIFIIFLHFCALDENKLSIRRVEKQTSGSHIPYYSAPDRNKCKKMVWLCREGNLGIHFPHLNHGLLTLLRIRCWWLI